MNVLICVNSTLFTLLHSYSIMENYAIPRDRVVRGEVLGHWLLREWMLVPCVGLTKYDCISNSNCVNGVDD